METTSGECVTHPVTDFATRARRDVEQARESRSLWSMTATEKQQALLDLTALQAQVESLRLELLVEAERAGDCTAEGDRTAADWLARQTQQRRPRTRADLQLATALDARYPVAAAALAAGSLNIDQARVIIRALEALPTTGPETVSAEQLADAEAFLVDHAAEHDAGELAVMGRRLYEVIAPEQSEEREGRALAAEEERAARRVSFEMREDDQGICHGRFRIGKLHGAMLAKALRALMSPARSTGETATHQTDQTDHAEEPVEAGTPPARQRPYAVRRGEAFCELIEALDRRGLPTAGGGDATVVVTMTLDDLLARLTAAGVATLDTGHRISAGQARRLAARHRVIPAVLGAKSEILDQGHAKRLFTKAQRLALAQTQGGCTADGCDAPAAMCHAHHDQPWSTGGPTDLANGRLLCGHHHRRIHDPAYDVTPARRQGHLPPQGVRAPHSAARCDQSAASARCAMTCRVRSGDDTV